MKPFFYFLLLFFALQIQAQQFQDQIIYQNTGNDIVFSLDYGDVNNDGNIDLLIARTTISNELVIVWQENLGNGSFGTQTTIRTSSGGANEMRGAQFIDANNDGNLDVIVAENTGENMILYYGDGNGNFPTSFLLDVFPFTPGTLKVSDFNGDGLDDILMMDPQDGFTLPKLYWYKNTAGSTFNFDPAFEVVNTTYSGAFATKLFDIDNDSNIDIVFPTIYGDIFNPSIRIDWYKSDGNGGIVGGIQTLVDGFPVSSISDFEMLDLNNDGHLDFAYIGGNSFGWFSGDSNQNFTFEQEITGISAGVVTLSGLSSADITQNGYIDFVFCLSGSFDRIHLLTNNSGSGFTLSTISDMPVDPLRSVIVDIDNDGDVDPISLASDDQLLLWHEVSFPSSGSEVYFSEYIEGSGTNKALEIANFTGQNVDLSSYTIRLGFNGNPFGSDISFPSGAFIADGDVYVIANTGLDTNCQSQQDVVNNSMTNFNGNDAIGLFKSGVLIDIIGNEGNSSNFAQNITLVRKPSISNPSTVFDINQWDNYTQDDCSNLGNHTQTLSTDDFNTNLISFYPNPVSDQLQLVSKTNPITGAELYTLTGQKVNISLNDGVINMGHLESGIYLLHVLSENKSVVQKIIKD